MSGARANIRKRGATYTYYAYVTGADGRRRQVSKGGFRTRREAEAARIEALNTIQTGTFVRAERVTVASFLVDEWLPSRRPPNLEESTYASYERDLRLHVIPYIGAIPLQKLTPMDLNALYRALLDKGRCVPPPPKKRHSAELVDRAKVLRSDGLTYQAVADRLATEFPEEACNISRNAVAALLRRAAVPSSRKAAPPGLKARTVRYVHTIVHAALKDALRWNRVARNVADAATPPPEGAARSPRPSAWTADDLRRFLDFVATSRYLPTWVFLATSGCRRGECLGVTWKDLDLDGGKAVLSQQVTVVNGKLRIKPLPKTKRAHLIRLDSITVAIVRSWRARQNEERLLVGPGYEDLDLAFCHPDGRPYQPDRVSREFLRKQAQYNRAHPERRLPRLVLHGLRHTWATLALEEGIDIKIVSERLNHSSTHVTREIYTHVTPPMQSDAADRVARTIFGTTL
ncbi:MAG: tyrosine-type recombinase/integrase [Pseudonocardiaceae bacterium]